MQFMLAVHNDVGPDDKFGAYSSHEEMEKALTATAEFNTRVHGAGQLIFAGGLMPATTARVVDGLDDLVTEGAYLTGAEHLGGFWVVEVPDEKTALQLAADASRACGSKVEVRPFAG